MAYPNIKSFNLPTCCQNRINQINKKVAYGNALQSVVSGGVLLNMFGPSPKGVCTVAAIQQTDFATFAQALQAVPIITRAVAKKECEQEWFNHIRGGSGQLATFWKGMVDVFS